MPAGDAPIAIAAADLDGDSDIDLVAANTDSDDLSLFWQTAPGVFTPAAAGTLLAGDGPVAVATADLDGDGATDLIAANAGSDDLSLFFQSAPGIFTPAAATLPAGDEPGSAAAADLDGDDDIDLVVANKLSGDLTIFFNGR